MNIVTESQKGDIKMKKLLIFAILIAIILVAANYILPIHGEAEIYDSVVRLHVLANSDSDEDQALKLKVRDAVLEITEPLLRECTDRDSAERILREAIPDIENAAAEVIDSEGYDYGVTVTLCEEEYPERGYDGFCFPSGTYMSMRVCIGSAQGHNWWCVLFPPLCMSAATVTKQDAEDAFISVGLTPDQYRIITETEDTTYRIRFKLLETIQSIFG